MHVTTGERARHDIRRRTSARDAGDVGINLTVPLTNKLRMGMQLFSRKLGNVGNFEIKADWSILPESRLRGS